MKTGIKNIAKVITILLLFLTSTIVLAAGVTPVKMELVVGSAESECAQVGTYSYALKVEGWDEENGNDGNFTLGDQTITISNSNGKYFDWDATQSLGAVLVKAGSNFYNVFLYDNVFSDTSLYARINPANQQLFGISHVTFCWNDPGTPTSELTVIKHVVGGEAVAGDFTINVTGTNVSQSNFPGAEDPGTTVQLDPGSYSVTEEELEGYAASYSEDCSGTIAAGESKTCTITNYDPPAELIVIKQVVGGNALASDFTINVTGTNVSPSSFDGAEDPGTTVELFPGSYSVSEETLQGYIPGYSEDCSGTIELGETKTCTITNVFSREAALTVIKHVINDDGGHAVAGDFLITVTNTNPQPAGIFAGEEDPGTILTLAPGAYSVSEDIEEGYSVSYSEDCTGTIVLGESKICTITNDDRPGKFVVEKVIINDDGRNKTASDFSFQVNGDQVINFNSNGQNTLTVDAGTYSITEPKVSGYSTTYDNCSRVNIENGEIETCVITNNDDPGGGDGGEEIPATGFPKNQMTLLPSQPLEKAYTELYDLSLEIPNLGISLPIVNVPLTDMGWDVTWLENEAGYLAGSAFPTWAGNTVITAHVWDALNNPGPFAEIKTLKYGDLVEIKAFGSVYTYEVRENKLITAKNVDAMLQHEENDWVTLMTCEFYNPINQDYFMRRLVRAVLIDVE